MKKLLTAIFCLVGLGSPALIYGQSFTVAVPSDTVTTSIITTASPSNNITNITGSNLTLKWHVDSTNFPADWLPGANFGICDNYSCRNNSASTLWNPATGVGDTFTSTYYANSMHDTTEGFSLSMDLTSATTLGSYWVTINITDQGPAGTSRNLTFILNKMTTAVPVIPNINSDVLLYPNPASDELNIIYDANADIKTIAVYNIIGKMMAVYKVNGPSANLNLESMPSGIYFVRLANPNGQVVATKKFTKQ